MKIIVTGSSGQVGSYILEHFAERNEVIGLDNRPCTYPAVAEHTHDIDLAVVEDLSGYIADADWIIHCAAQVSVEKSIEEPLFDAKNNILGTVNLLWNAFKHDVGNFLYLSSAAVFGDPIGVPIDEGHPTEPLSPYGVSKLCGEKYVIAFSKSYDLNTVIIRPFNIYSKRADPASPYSGVITKFVNWSKEKKPLIIEGDGSQTRDFVHISDLIQMVDLAVHKNASKGRIFNCGTGTGCSIAELADIVISLFSEKVGIEHAPPRPGDIKHSRADIRLATELLDYSPKMELREGLEEMLS